MNFQNSKSVEFAYLKAVNSIPGVDEKALLPKLTRPPVQLKRIVKNNPHLDYISNQATLIFLQGIIGAGIVGILIIAGTLALSICHYKN